MDVLRRRGGRRVRRRLDRPGELRPDERHVGDSLVDVSCKRALGARAAVAELILVKQRNNS